MTLIRRLAITTLIASSALVFGLLVLAGNLTARTLQQNHQLDALAQLQLVQAELGYDSLTQVSSRFPNLTISLAPVTEANTNQSAVTPAWYQSLLQPWTLIKDTSLSGLIAAVESQSTAFNVVSSSAPYLQQWRQQMTLFSSILIGLAATLVLLVLTVFNKYLRSLAEVAHRADSLSHLEFLPPLKRAGVKELDTVAQSLNRLSDNIRDALATNRSQIAQLTEQLYTDPVSGLTTRVQMTEQIDNWLRQPDSGALLMVNLSFLEPMRQHLGFDYRDKLVALFAQRLLGLRQTHPSLNAARFSASEFVAITSGDSCSKAVNDVQALVDQLYQQTELELSKPYGIGVVYKQMQQNPEQILAQADQAQLHALLEPNHTFCFDKSEQRPAFRRQWKDDIEVALEQQRLQFDSTPVVDGAGDRVQLEMNSKLEVQGRWMTERELSPYLQLLGLGQEFDKTKLRLATTLENKFTPLVFQLRLQSVEDSEFLLWLEQLLYQQPFPFQFEIAEATVIRAPDSVKELRQRLKNLGYQLGVNHVGVHHPELDYINWLVPDYVKLDPAYCAKPLSPLLQRSCETMINQFHSMNIGVYFMDMPNEQAKKRFEAVPFNGFSWLGQQSTVTFDQPIRTLNS